jgi:hypothetical protein
MFMTVGYLNDIVMYGAWKRRFDLGRCLRTVTDDVSKEYSHKAQHPKLEPESRKSVKKVCETKDRLVRKYLMLEAAIFLRANKSCEINGIGDNTVKADIHTLKKVQYRYKSTYGMNKQNGEGSGHNIAYAGRKSNQ